MNFRTLLIDPPWPQTMRSPRNRKREGNLPPTLPYPTMSLAAIKALPVQDLADTGAHLWLWTTNQFLRDGFDCMTAWGFKYLAPITWRKPSGMGNYFIHVTQTVLFGYHRRCEFNADRYLPTYFEGLPQGHSGKPVESYRLIERISDPARLELFARPWTPLITARPGWHVWGNEVQDPSLALTWRLTPGT
jgi:N6-adenosine-specific RNA methylase IME4